MRLAVLNNRPIFEQLMLEEALLRATSEEWCLLNSGSPPAIVMGISGRPEELIFPEGRKLPLIRRFSGGGCVVVDESTLFVTFIGNVAAPTPQKIHDWVLQKLTPLFQGLPFSLKENDYLLGERKVGGNAQAITKNRFLHHTSFLLDYNPELMALLKMPKKTPTYRAGRDHETFITRLKPHFPSPESFFCPLIESFENPEKASQKELSHALLLPHRRSNLLL